MRSVLLALALFAALAAALPEPALAQGRPVAEACAFCGGELRGGVYNHRPTCPYHPSRLGGGGGGGFVMPPPSGRTSARGMGAYAAGAFMQGFMQGLRSSQPSGPSAADLAAERRRLEEEARRRAEEEQRRRVAAASAWRRDVDRREAEMKRRLEGVLDVIRPRAPEVLSPDEADLLGPDVVDLRGASGVVDPAALGRGRVEAEARRAIAAARALARGAGAEDRIFAGLPLDPQGRERAAEFSTVQAWNAAALAGPEREVATGAGGLLGRGRASGGFFADEVGGDLSPHYKIWSDARELAGNVSEAILAAPRDPERALLLAEGARERFARKTREHGWPDVDRRARDLYRIFGGRSD